MNAEPPRRGLHFVTADRHFATGGLFSRIAGKGFHRVLDRIDIGLEQGMLEAWLPDGSNRVLGGRGAGPMCEVRVNSWRALLRLAQSGSVGWYKAWELGEWESPDPVPLFALFMANRVTLGSTARAKGPARWMNRALHALRANSRDRARRNIEHHYDLGEDFYALWLDETMSYSAALFADPDHPVEPFEAAQFAKMDAVLDRLALRDGTSVLEIGCGWGGFGAHACDRHAIDYTGITISPSQREHAARVHGEDERRRFQLADYRDVTGRYDAIASIEMVEAVGQRYWPDYLEGIARCLKPGGRAALQYIRIEDDIFERYAANADFIQTYIFPGGMLLSESRFRALAEARGLEWRDQHDFGLHYAATLKLWRERFDAAVETGQLPAGFDAHFVKLWRYYLMYCEGGFRGGGINVSQVTLVKA